MVCLMKVIAVLLYKYTKDKIRRVTFPTCTVHPASGYIVKMKTRYASQVQKAKWSYLVNVREYVKQLGNNLHIVMRYITWQLYVVLFSSIPPPPFQFICFLRILQGINQLKLRYTKLFFAYTKENLLCVCNKRGLAATCILTRKPSYMYISEKSMTSLLEQKKNLGGNHSF